MPFAGDEYIRDGCDWNCEWETPYTDWECTTVRPAVDINANCWETCTTTGDYYNFECKDGNWDRGDGCDENCEIERGWSCHFGSPVDNDVCREVCGDGFMLGYHHCEDWNNESGDGCSSRCHIEQGYECLGATAYEPDYPTPTLLERAPDTCTEICGKGKNLGTYECDDGNLIDGDGCSATCTIETGYTCMGGGFYTADFCFDICSDGITVNAVTGMCDDGNVINGDGCSIVCFVEDGWECTGGSLTSPDTCNTICGDGKTVVGVEECDVGNTNGD